MNVLNIMPLGAFGTWEIVAIVLVILLIFGGKKIPELMRGLGKGVKEFKSGLNEIQEDIDNAGTPKSSGKVLEPDKIEKKQQQ